MDTPHWLYDVAAVCAVAIVYLFHLTHSRLRALEAYDIAGADQREEMADTVGDLGERLLKLERRVHRGYGDSDDDYGHA